MINPHASVSEHLFSALLYLQLMVLVYSNNLVLIPRLLIKKKYPAYFISILLHIFIIACSYIYTLKLVLRYHPGIELHRLVLFVYGSLTPELSFSAVLREVIVYYINLLNLAFVFTLVWYLRDYFHQQKLTEELKKKQLETELLFLKGQINPHFLFNTLNNLYGLSLEPGEHTSHAILKLSSILRYFLYESNSESVAFEKEKEVMLAYIDMELLRLRQKNNLHFTITADMAYQLPPLLWLPILENVFKHGTRFIDNELFIDFKFTITNNKLAIYSKNKFKVNENHNELEKSSGIGLMNLRQRLEILYPGRYRMETTPDNEYYIVEVEITFN